jgi:hypothetical protein
MAQDKPIEQRTKAALEQVVGKTVKSWDYRDEGHSIVLRFTDGAVLEVDTTYDREIKGVQGEPFLMAHSSQKRS